MSVTTDAVLRSAPNPARPRLRTESERKLADVDIRSAACYADAEDLTERLKAYAAQLDDEEDSSAVPVNVESMDDTSSVHHLEVLREKCVTTETPPLR